MRQKRKYTVLALISAICVIFLGVLLRWHSLAPRELVILRGHKRWVNCLAFSGDGKLLASGGLEGEVIVWNTASWNIHHVYELGHGSVGSLCFLPTPSKLAVGAGCLSICDLDTGTHEDFSNTNGAIGGIVALPDSNEFLVIRGANVVEKWRGSSPVSRYTVKNDPFYDSHPTLVGTQHVLAVAPLGPGPLLLDADSGQLIAEMPQETTIYWCLAASPKGDLIAAGDTRWKVHLWDVRERKEIASYREHGWPVDSVAFSPDGSLLASGSYETVLATWGGHGDIVLWDVPARRSVARLRCGPGAITALAFSPTDPILASGSNSDPGEIRIWPVPSSR